MDRFIHVCFLNAFSRNVGSHFACGSIEFVDESRRSSETPDYLNAYTPTLHSLLAFELCM